MRVNEIFYSLQGEGFFTGRAAVFLRFAGCNLQCPFCDTDHHSFREMTEAQIVAEMATFPARHAVITGGEPAMQLTATLVEKLRRAGFFVQIETNGSLPLPEGIDWITCSPKSLPVVLPRINELKVVYGADTDMAPYGHVASIATHLRVQPRHDALARDSARNLAAAISFVKSNPRWSLSLQTHRLINIH